MKNVCIYVFSTFHFIQFDVFKLCVLISLYLFLVRNQDEVLMDSEMMSISSNVLKQCTRRLTSYVCSYNHVEFAQKLVCIIINVTSAVVNYFSNQFHKYV